ncbi:hypothetical protein OQA88_5589 [Cercophora sp. LCS_1]
MGNQASVPDVLKFEKRRSDNPQHLNISLHRVSLSKKPRYHCLSYFWGDPAFVWPIYVNGVLTHITPNLGAALKQLEHEDIEALWADGLCINQRDTDEKEDQAKKMPQIYQGCVANFAWLGVGDSESYRAMQVINTFSARLFRVLMAAALDKTIARSGDGAKLGSDVKLRDALRLKSDTDTRDLFTFKRAPEVFTRGMTAAMLDSIDQLLGPDDYRKLRDELFPSVDNESDFEGGASLWLNIMGRPLWERIWVVQEMVLLEMVILKCGESSARLDYLIAVYEYVQKSMNTKLDPPESLQFGKRVQIMHRRFSPPEASLGFIANARCNKFSARHASQSWDTIHAMLQRLRYLQGDRWIQYRDFPEVPTECPGSGVSPYWPSWVNIGEQIFPSGLNFPPRYHIHKGHTEILIRQFEVSKSYTYQLSPLNFTSLDVLRVPCRVIGKVGGVCDLSARTWDRDESDFAVAQMAMARAVISETERFFERGGNLHHSLRGKPLWWLFSLQSDRPSSSSHVPVWEQLKEEYREQFFIPKRGENRDDWGHCLSHRAAIIRWLGFCSPFTVDAGYVGLGPGQMQIGDMLVIFPDVDVPHVLRPVGDRGYKIIGQMYVLGIMHGEFLEDNPPEIMADLL